MIALIPARLGSKRFPGKNRASFRGKSLLSIANQTAIESGVLEGVYLSTDDDLLIREANNLGISVPFKRDTNIAQDGTSTWEVVRDFLTRTGYVGDICLLQLTSPLRESKDISNLYRIYKSNDSNRALTVCNETIAGSLRNDWLCECSDIISSIQHCQNSHPVLPNGSVYMLKSTSSLNEPYSPLVGSSGLVMPQERSLDVDYAHQLENY